MTHTIEIVTNPTTSWEHRDNYEVDFHDLQNETQQTAMLDCHDFRAAAERAADGSYTYDPIRCGDSECSVRVKCLPSLGKIEVKGACPYLKLV